MEEVLSEYGFKEGDYQANAFGSGLINSTWFVETGSGKYILQKVNDAVFKKPEDIDANMRLISKYLRETDDKYFFVSPLPERSGKTLVYFDKAYYRMFPFVQGSHAIDVVQNHNQGYEAAKQFGRFTCKLSGIDISQIRITLPYFHDLSLRYNQFCDAIKNGDQQRIKEASFLIRSLSEHTDIVKTYESVLKSADFKQRVTHHDTKISNVLFDDKDKGICVIDLDTVMPGYFISDVGDMMRTYLSPVSEEEKDFTRIEIRDDYYDAILNGYYEEMGDELSAAERHHFFYSGTFMIYMQALRFLTDYLNNDVYYGSKYPGHNYVRAQNQGTLLTRLLEKKQKFMERAGAPARVYYSRK